MRCSGCLASHVGEFAAIVEVVLRVTFGHIMFLLIISNIVLSFVFVCMVLTFYVFLALIHQ
jgi:hypothetical protein